MKDHEGPDNGEQLFSENQVAHISHPHSLLFLLLSDNFIKNFSFKFNREKGKTYQLYMPLVPAASYFIGNTPSILLLSSYFSSLGA